MNGFRKSMKWASSKWLKEPIGTWRSAGFRFGIEAQRRHASLAVRPGIKGYARGFRILVGFFESLRRSALTTDLPIDIGRESFIQACCERLATSPSIPPVTVSNGPILQNLYKEDDIDLFKFPVPLWHKRDGADTSVPATWSSRAIRTTVG